MSNVVKLLIYDISYGNGKHISKLLGCDIQYVYHTAIVVYGHEIYFGGAKDDNNVQCVSPFDCRNLCDLCQDNDGIFCYPENYLRDNNNFHPIEVLDMGRTNMTEEQLIGFLTFLQNNLDTSKCFRKKNYNILKYNCNTFTNYLCRHMINREIPYYILDLPNRILNTSIGRFIDTFFPYLFSDIKFDNIAASLKKLEEMKTSLGLK